MGDQLSPQDIQDLSAIRSKLSPDDPRAAKIGMLLAQNNPNYQRDQLNLQRNAQPTQFERDRNPENQPGLFSSGGKELLNLAGGFANTIAQGMSGNIPAGVNAAAQMGNQIAMSDFNRQQMGRSLPYRVTAGVGQAAGINAPAMEHASDVGNAKELVGTALADAVPTMAGAAARAVGKVASLEGNPHVLYQKYLEPVADTPHPMPEITPKQMSALRNQVSINHPDIAQRMVDGTTTIGDLDVIRQVANNSSKPAFGNAVIPPERAAGFQAAADKIRDVIYPAIERGNGLQPGSIAKIKGIQGDLLNMGKAPKLGYDPWEWPAKVADVVVKRPALDAIHTARTKILAARLNNR